MRIAESCRGCTGAECYRLMPAKRNLRSRRRPCAAQDDRILAIRRLNLPRCRSSRPSLSPTANGSVLTRPEAGVCARGNSRRARLGRSRRRSRAFPLETFCAIAESLAARKLVGRFSTFLEHVKPSQTGARVTRFNALVPLGGPAGARNGGRRRSWPSRNTHPLLLARRPDPSSTTSISWQ